MFTDSQYEPTTVVIFDPATLGQPVIVLNAYDFPTWFEAATLAGEMMDEMIAANLDVILVAGDRFTLTNEALYIEIRKAIRKFGTGA